MFFLFWFGFGFSFANFFFSRASLSFLVLAFWSCFFVGGVCLGVGVGVSVGVDGKVE